jgi:coproporphyrinogen III oxidase-like Fe-S oxidoreductase
MTTIERKKSRNNRNEALRQQFTVSNDKSLMPEEQRKYDILRQLRIKLGKSKEEFQKIFELFNNLQSQKNS